MYGAVTEFDEVEAFIDFYLNSLIESDRHLGRVLAALEAHDEVSGVQSCVIQTSDHVRITHSTDSFVISLVSSCPLPTAQGEMLGEHECRQKGNLLYSENLHVPLVIRHPGIAPPNKGADSSALVSSCDLVPTILDIAGAPMPDGLPGQSILPCVLASTAEGKDNAERNAVLVQFGHDYSRVFTRVEAAPGKEAEVGQDRGDEFHLDAAKLVAAPELYVRMEGFGERCG